MVRSDRDQLYNGLLRLGDDREVQVDDRLAEAVKLRHALREFGVPVDVIVMEEGLVERRSKVKGTMVDRALREGRVVAQS